MIILFRQLLNMYLYFIFNAKGMNYHELSWIILIVQTNLISIEKVSCAFENSHITLSLNETNNQFKANRCDRGKIKSSSFAICLILLNKSIFI